MRYMGGKSRIAKKLAKVMLEYTDNRGTYVEPFLGGAAVAKEMGHHFDHAFYSDFHKDLSMMWTYLVAGVWEMPDEISEEDYNDLKTKLPSPLRGFIGFAASFGGKWFGGYARGKTNKGESRNYVLESKKNNLKCLEGMRAKLHTTVQCKSFEDVVVCPGDVVYCDPPYADTTGYSTGKLDHEKFWKTMTDWAKSGAVVFVSEYEAPEDWEVLWETEIQSLLQRAEQGRHNTTEKLFVYRG